MSLALAQPGTAFAQVQKTWSARYNGPANGWDSAVAVTTDASGNVYVAGPSEASGGNSDYVALKYTPAGDLVWALRYNGTGNGNDIPAAMGVDVAGNVYLTGTSRAASGHDDIVTIKYDANTNQVWLARYTGGGAQNSAAAAMAIDGSGNVYVAGTASNSTAFVALKYNSLGTEVWKAFYPGTNSFSVNSAAVLALDAQGNVYVTGASAPAYFAGAYATLKYDTDGNRLWVARYAGPGGLNYPAAIGLDASGNVYVTGRSEEAAYAGRYDYATVKYDPNGSQLWVARYASMLGSRNDSARALAMGSTGAVYVTGTSAGASADDLVTIKYASDGSQTWLARYNGPVDGPESAAGIALDNAGNAYVNGSSRGTGGSLELATVKYPSDGTQLWVARSSATISSNLASRPLVLGISNEVYACGEMAGLTASKDFGLFRYDQAAISDYPQIISQPQPQSVVQGSNATFTVDATGPALGFEWHFNGRTQAVAMTQTLVLTNAQAAQQGDYSVRVSNAVGWVESPAARLTVSYITNQPQSLAVAQGGDAWFKVGAVGAGPFSYQWQFNGGTISGVASNVLVLTNVQPASAGYYVAFVSNAAGVLQSATAQLSVLTRVRQVWADARDPGYSLALDPATNVCVTGSRAWSDPTSDCITAKFTPGGARLWRAQYNGPGNGFDGLEDAFSFRGRLIASDQWGNTLVSCCSKSAGGPADFDCATIKYDTNGNPVWIARLDGNPATETASPSALALDSSGNVYVTGSGGSYTGDGYLTVKYDNAGNQLWVAHYTNADFATDLTLDGAGNAYVAGRDSVTVKYDPMGTQMWATSSGGYSWTVVLDSQTNVVVIGEAYRSETDYDYMTAKYDRDGTNLWTLRYPDSGLAFDAAWDVAVGPQDTLYVTGTSGTVKYSPAGGRLWTAAAGGRNIKLNAAGEAYLLDSTSASATGNDYSLKKLDKDGNFLWEARYGTANDDSAAALVLDNAGSIYVTGNAGTVKFLEQTWPPLHLNAEFSPTNGMVRVTLTGEAGRFYAIQSSGDLRTWTSVTTLVNNEGVARYSEPAPANLPRRFYRAVLVY